jgi:hypothetical protein
MAHLIPVTVKSNNNNNLEYFRYLISDSYIFYHNKWNINYATSREIINLILNNEFNVLHDLFQSSKCIYGSLTIAYVLLGLRLGSLQFIQYLCENNYFDRSIDCVYNMDKDLGYVFCPLKWISIICERHDDNVEILNYLFTAENFKHHLKYLVEPTFGFENQHYITCIKNNNINCLKMILEYRQCTLPIVESFFCMAIQFNSVNIMAYMIENGYETLIIQCQESNLIKPEMVKLLVESHYSGKINLDSALLQYLESKN